jgi:GntR family transcriptional regulator
MFDQNMLPKYYVLKKELIDRIEKNEFKSDEQIPSERDLIQAYGFSRITVRKAIDELVNEGYLYKVHGKGTFVKDNVVQQDIVQLNSITHDILQMGKKPSRKVLRLKEGKAYEKRALELQIDMEENIVIVDRIHYADDEPINRTIDYLPAKLFPGMINHDLEHQSLFNTIEKEYGIKITKATRTIEAINADEEVASMLGVKKGIPILLFRGITYGLIDGKEIPIESYKSYYRSDNRRFSITQNKVS